MSDAARRVSARIPVSAGAGVLALTLAFFTPAATAQTQGVAAGHATSKLKTPASKPSAAPPPIPATPPPAPTLPPPIVVPTRPMPPPEPAVVVADAAGEATAEAHRLRITFGPASANLNPRTDTAIRDFARQAPPFASATFSVVSVAPGSDEDPSTPRRLSLARALAVRSVLITEGIASARIFVKAMGANPQAMSGGPADRADVTLGGLTPDPQQGKTK